jgi:hypothetical protein
VGGEQLIESSVIPSQSCAGAHYFEGGAALNQDDCLRGSGSVAECIKDDQVCDSLGFAADSFRAAAGGSIVACARRLSSIEGHRLARSPSGFAK